MENIQNIIDILNEEIEELKSKKQNIKEEMRVLGEKKHHNIILINDLKQEIEEERQEREEYIYQQNKKTEIIVSVIYMLILYIATQLSVSAVVALTLSTATKVIIALASSVLIGLGIGKLIPKTESYFKNKIYNSEKNQHMISVIDELKEDLEIDKNSIKELELSLNNKKTEYVTCENQIILLNNAINYILESQNLIKTINPCLELSEDKMEETKGIQRTRNL